MPSESKHLTKRYGFESGLVHGGLGIEAKLGKVGFALDLSGRRIPVEALDVVEDASRGDVEMRRPRPCHEHILCLLKDMLR